MLGNFEVEINWSFYIIRNTFKTIFFACVTFKKILGLSIERIRDIKSFVRLSQYLMMALK